MEDKDIKKFILSHIFLMHCITDAWWKGYFTNPDTITESFQEYLEQVIKESEDKE